MCGICGYLHTGDADRPVAKDLLHRMCAVMTHRGPDDEGIYTDGAFGMGMRRLSIIDLSSGQQPIFNETGRIAIVCNGEIYNFPELRQDLEAKGHRFSTNSDVEVAVHIYEEEGVEGLVSKLNGMYGLAIWDADRRSLLLVRDRLGIKPLYYWLDHRRLAFASELKCLMEDPELPRDFDPVGLNNFLSLNYIPAPQSIYRAVSKLPPAHYLQWRDGKVKIERYWTLQYSGDGRTGPEQPEAWYAERLLELLKAAVKRHLISDVPLGVLCSGGIDSSSMVAIVSRWFNRQVKTFSIGFEEDTFNELKYARLVARLFETDHREELVRPDAAGLLPKLVWHLDEPFADHSAIPTYYVSRLARRDVTVVLSGDGGDELFAGYETYAALRYAKLLRRLPGPLVRGLLQPAVGMLPVSDKKVSLDYKAKRLLSGYQLSPAQAHLAWKVIFTEEDKRSLYAADYRAGLTGQDTAADLFSGYFGSAAASDDLDRLLYVDTMVYLPDDILMKVDKMSMAVSLESRVPLLDYTVAEFAASIPARYKLKGRQKKHILKQSLKGLLPDTTLYRKKAGFSLPIAAWIKGSLREMVLDVLSPDSLLRTGLFNPDYVRQVIDDHLAGRRDNSRPIWGLTNFMLWCDALHTTTSGQSSRGRG
jgi:asparagine synthase (glutamine-hydrolysing)